MKVLAVRSFSVGTISPSSETRPRRSLSKWTAVLFFSFVSATAAGILGLMFWALSLMHATLRFDRLQTVGTLLIVAAFPLMAVAAHCLDKIDSADKAARLNRCRMHGSTDVE